MLKFFAECLIFSLSDSFPGFLWDSGAGKLGNVPLMSESVGSRIHGQYKMLMKQLFIMSDGVQQSTCLGYHNR